jgi:hypothetical protein
MAAVAVGEGVDRDQPVMEIDRKGASCRPAGLRSIPQPGAAAAQDLLGHGFEAIARAGKGCGRARPARTFPLGLTRQAVDRFGSLAQTPAKLHRRFPAHLLHWPGAWLGDKIIEGRGRFRFFKVLIARIDSIAASPIKY